jgi:transposase
VNRYSGTNGEKKPPKDNPRNSRPEEIDRTEHHSLDNPICPGCGGHGRRRGTSTRKRIVIELQLPQAEIVEHECDIYECKECGKVFSPPVPNALPKTEFDITTTVFISYLFIAAKMSIGDIRSLLHLFGVNVSEGSITNAMKRLKYYLGDYYSDLLEKVKSAPTRYKDETSHRFNGRNFWAWVIATKEWVYYAIERRRSQKVAKALGSDIGVDVCDGYAGYNKLKSEKQRDWAHLLRIAKKPRYQFGEEENFAEYKRFVARLSRLHHSAKCTLRKGKLSRTLRGKYDRRLWVLLQTAPTHGRNITRLINYLMKFDGQWFTFLQYKGVEPTNNRAERALRPMVIKRRISQQSRGADNMDSYAMQMSMYMTTKVQGQDYIEKLSDILRSGVSSKPYNY